MPSVNYEPRVSTSVSEVKGKIIIGTKLFPVKNEDKPNSNKISSQLKEIIFSIRCCCLIVSIFKSS